MSLAEQILRGDRKALARAITLVESTRTEDMDSAEQLLARLSPQTGSAYRVGITGVPGVGKSTFIEALGTHLTGLGHRVAVLAVDPTSSVSGGSILGDKTRMDRLSRDPNAFVRPSPGGRTAGGVGRRTREAGLLCEAAGYDVLLIETIGAGQADIAVSDMVDFFLLLVLPGAGDDLQGIKRGVMELADGLVVTKADGENTEPAKRASRQLQLAIDLLHPGKAGWKPAVLIASAVENRGIEEVWDQIKRHHDLMKTSGGLWDRRRDQRVAWVGAALRDLLLEELFRSPEVAKMLPELQKQVLEGTLQPTAAARRLLAAHADREGRANEEEGD